MITIENKGPFNDKIEDKSNYTLVIAGQEVCSFQHRRIDGLGKCLLEAARAFEESEAKRIQNEPIVEPRALRPFVNALWGKNGCVNLDFRVQDFKDSSHRESHGCGDLEGFLRALVEMKDRGIKKATVSFY